MHTFGTLYRYELKKLLQKKVSWFLFSLCLILSAMMIVSDLFGNYYVNGKKMNTYYELFRINQKYERALTGQAIDQQLLEKMKSEYDILNAEAARYGEMATDEQRLALNMTYQTHALPYRAIYNHVRGTAGMTASEMDTWDADEKDMYARRQNMLENRWQKRWLSEEEKTYWREKEDHLEKPVVYYYKEGYWVLFNKETSIGFLVLFAVAVCLSGIFTEEHTRRTDQLLLCSKKGRTSLYWAKLAAGGSFAVALTVANIVFAGTLAFIIYGTDGNSAAIQLIHHEYSFPLTVAQAVMIVYGILVISAMLLGLCVMVLSETLHSNIATLAVETVFLFAQMMVSIPSQYRVVSQIWDCLPGSFYTIANIFDLRLISLFGHYFTAWQAVPVFYLAAGAMAAIVGKALYGNYQVTGM